MRKTLLLAAVVAAIAVSAARAEGTQNFYDARGNKIGSATTIGSTTVPRTGSAVVSPRQARQARRPRPQRRSGSEGRIKTGG
jgi:hypothetical protein